MLMMIIHYEWILTIFSYLLFCLRKGGLAEGLRAGGRGGGPTVALFTACNPWLGFGSGHLQSRAYVCSMVILETLV